MGRVGFGRPVTALLFAPLMNARLEIPLSVK